MLVLGFFKKLVTSHEVWSLLIFSSTSFISYVRAATERIQTQTKTLVYFILYQVELKGMPFGGAEEGNHQGEGLSTIKRKTDRFWNIAPLGLL